MSITAPFRTVARSLRTLLQMVAERDTLRDALDALRSAPGWPAGHFYSPVPSLADVARDDSMIFATKGREIPGVDLRESEQIALLDTFRPLYASLDFPERKTPGFRYYFENPNYSYSDAVFLHCMIRHLKPRRILEIGSGHSSCATLDTNERCFAGGIETTFIEPYPELLLSLVTEEDRRSIRILPERVQDVPISEFKALEANDILFVDSTHVSKVNSDVNRIFAEILPVLQRGVHVHFHDAFYPFEYPREWIYQGRAWNELYMLRAFLQYNAGFSVVLMNSFLEQFHREYLQEHMPNCLRCPGASLWMRRE